MTVKIVTDSLCDLTGELIGELDITIIPLTVLFGQESFLDRVTISPEDFYKRLVQGDVWPTSSQPTPQDFAGTYDKLAETTDEILVITVSSKLSGTLRSANKGKEYMKNRKCRVEVIDSETVAGGQGLIALAAAKEAQNGGSLDKLVEFTRKAIKRCHFVVYLDTLKYLSKGGRIGKAQSLLGSVLSIKPILSVKDGEISPLSRVRSSSSGVAYLDNYRAGFRNIEAVMIEHTTTEDTANKLTELFKAAYPKMPVLHSTVCPVLGVYAGPDAFAISIMEKA